MIRHLAPLPPIYNIAQVETLTRTRYVSAKFVNEVVVDGTPNAAVYFDGFSPSSTSLTLWRADVLAHVPAPLSALEVERAGAPDRLRAQYSALRTWSADAAVVAAQGSNVTQAQTKALFDRFGKLCDGLADLLLYMRVDG